jgi:hypothetical protein
MELKTVLTCPLGAKCEEIKDNAIHRCVWFQTFAGTNPSTGEQVDERGCAMAWLPILMIENSKQQLSTSVAVESFRNEMVKAQETSQQILIAAALSKPQTLKYVEEQ